MSAEALNSISPATWSALRTITLSAEASGHWGQITPKIIDALRSVPRETLPQALDYLALQLSGDRRTLYRGLSLFAESHKNVPQYYNFLTQVVGVGGSGLLAWSKSGIVTRAAMSAVISYAERGAVGTVAWYAGWAVRSAGGAIRSALGFGAKRAGAATLSGMVGLAGALILIGLGVAIYTAYNTPPARSTAGQETASRARFGQSIETSGLPPAAQQDMPPESTLPRGGGCPVPFPATLSDGRGALCSCRCPDIRLCGDPARELANCDCSCPPLTR